MSRKHPLIEEHERELFRKVMDGVEQLSGQARAAPERPPAVPDARMTRADLEAVLAEMRDGPLDARAFETGEELAFRQPGIQDGVLRKLKRGQFSVQGELDLHGFTAEAAKLEVALFLREAQRRHWRCVRIIHGKGRRSGQGGPVLKTKVAHWLRQRRDVLAYASAQPAHGGSGALYVLLRAA